MPPLVIVSVGFFETFPAAVAWILMSSSATASATHILVNTAITGSKFYGLKMMPIAPANVLLATALFC